jgi:uncharacterized protein
MAWQDILSAIALMLVFEGIMPFMSPASYRKTMVEVLKKEDRVLRNIGLFAMLCGLGLLWIVR